MKMETNRKQVFQSNNSVRTAFSIKSSAKAFEILSSGLYTHKIRAIVRELGTNAFDSTFEATKARMVAAGGNPTRQEVLDEMKPFEVHLPNNIEPWFSIKDFGKGLSDEEVRGQLVVEDEQEFYVGGIYTTYFDSDKTDTNDLTGCLGLGSKSPFAYTEQFLVTTIKDGRKYIFNSFVNEEGEPNITLLSESNTSEENGVEIRFPVLASDFWDFKREAEHVYRWFEKKPVFLGQDVNFGESSYLYKSSEYGLCDGEQSYLIMGNVSYPIGWHDFNDKVQEKFNNVEEILLKHGVHIWVELGEAEPAASREKLQMNRISFNTIKTRLSQISLAVEADIRQKFENANNYHEARLLHLGLFARTDSTVSLIFSSIEKQTKKNQHTAKEMEENIEKLVKEGHSKAAEKIKEKLLDFKANNRMEFEPITYKGEVVNHRIETDKKVLVQESKADGSVVDLIEKKPMVIAHMCERRGSYRGSYSLVFDKFRVREFIAENNLTLFISDMERGNFPAVERYMENNSMARNEKVILLEQTGGESVEEFIRENYLDYYTIVRTSEVPKPERNKSERSNKKSAKAVALTGNFDWDIASCSWEDHEIDIDEGGVYVEVNRYDWRAGKLSGRNQEDYVRPFEMVKFYEMLMRLVPDLKVIGIRKGLMNRIEKSKKWVRLDHFIVNFIKEKGTYMLEKASKLDLWKALESQHKETLLRYNSDEFEAGSFFADLVDDLKSLHDSASDESVKDFLKVHQQFSYLEGVESLPEQSELLLELNRRLNEEIWRKYPMLAAMESLHSYHWNVHKDKIADYVRLCDKQCASVDVEAA